LATALLGAGWVVAGAPSSALGDLTTNPDGSHTATVTFPNPPGFPCPSTFNGTTSTSLSVFVPLGAHIVSHQLTFNPPCAGTGVGETFNPNASDPPPAADDQTARDDFTVTCTTMGGCGSGVSEVTLAVTYFDPVAPPLPANPLKLQGTARFRGDNPNSSILATLTPGLPDVDLVDAHIWSVPKRSKKHKAKPVRLGSVPDTHIPAGTQSVRLKVHLTRKGEKLLGVQLQPFDLKASLRGGQFGIYSIQSNGTYKRIG
jgi:hypothetical protein